MIIPKILQMVSSTTRFYMSCLLGIKSTGWSIFLRIIYFRRHQRGGGGGGSTLYEIYIGFCPRIDYHNIMHIDCLTYDYSICETVFLLPIYMVKKRDVM